MVEKAATEIKEKELPDCSSHNLTHKRYRYAVVILFLVLLAPVVAVMVAQETTNRWTTRILRVQFDSAALSSYSGCYEIDTNSKLKKRYSYNSHQANAASAKLAYCKDKRRWFFFRNRNAIDPCDVFNSELEIARSSKTDSFDVEKSFDEQWFSAINAPIAMNFVDVGNLDETCDSFLDDGKGSCDPVFNNFLYGFDGGDCCADTCNGLHCGKVDVSDVETRFPSCELEQSDDMLAIIIRLDEEMNLNQNHLLKLDCDFGTNTYNVFTVTATNFMENKIEHAVVKIESNCTFYVDDVQNLNTFPTMEYGALYSNYYPIFQGQTHSNTSKLYFEVPRKFIILFMICFLLNIPSIHKNYRLTSLLLRRTFYT